MTTAQKNQFSEFEYFQAPDFAKGFDEVKNMDAWSDVGKQLKANEKATEANIKSFQNLIDKAGKFSKTAKQAWEVQRDKEHKKLTNENKLLVRDLRLAGHTDQGNKLAAFNKADSEHNQETGYYNVLAAKLEAEGKSELAQRVRNLTGRRGKVFKEVLVLNAANRYYDNFIETRDDVQVSLGKDEDGVEQFLTWGSAKTTSERQMVMDQWQVENGLDINSIGGLNDEFLAKHYWPKIEQENKKIHGEHAKLVKSNELAELESAEREKLLEAVKTGGDSSGEAVFAFLDSHSGTYGGSVAARLKARDMLLDMVKKEQITVEQFKSIFIYKTKHKGMGGKEVGLDAWKEFNLEENSDLHGLLDQAELAGIQRAEAKRTLDSARFVADVKAQVAKLDRPITETEATQMIQKFQEVYPNLDVPPELNNYLNNTLEDQDDKEHVAVMEDKLRRAEKLGDEWKQIKGSVELREKWRKIAESAEGQGLDPANLKAMNTEIELKVKDVLGLTMGISQTNTPTYFTMTQAAKADYARAYRQSMKITKDPNKSHEYARDLVMNKLSTEGGKAYKVEPTRSNHQQAIKKRFTAFRAIAENGDSAITGSMLPGTEEDFKRLEAYAIDPVNNKIPMIYHQVAMLRNIEGYTSWHVAKDQYKAVTGKDFPSKPDVIQRLESKSPLTKYLMIKYPNNRSVKRAVIEDKNGGDYSIEGAVTPGLTMEVVG